VKTPDDKVQLVPRLGLTRQQAADAIGVSVETVDRLTREGKLKPNRATRRPLYSPDELANFVKGTPAVSNR